MPYTAQCFSGECGLCFQCCETGTNWFENLKKEESKNQIVFVEQKIIQSY